MGRGKAGSSRKRTPAELERIRIESNEAQARMAFAAYRSTGRWSTVADDRPTIVTLLRPLLAEFGLTTQAGPRSVNMSGFGLVDPASNLVYLNPAAPGRIDSDNWAYVIAHLMVHLGLGHHRGFADEALQAAREVEVDTFVRSMGLVAPPGTYALPEESSDDVERMAQAYREGRPFSKMTMAGPGTSDCIPETPVAKDYEPRFAEGLEALVAARAQALRPAATKAGVAEEALRQVVNRYPLLASMAQRVRIVSDRASVAREGVDIAAVNPVLGEIYLAIEADTTVREAIFSLAHELLHLGLRHVDRIRGRDPMLWNAACDFVINGWLVEMGVGTMPQRGLLYDPALAGKSADEIYDLLMLEPARRRKLRSFRGMNQGDIILSGPRTVVRGDVSTLDDVWAGALRYGRDAYRLRYGIGRGTLPEGLEEEINALDMDPVPWDVALAHWFEEFVAAAQPVRTYARASRRQASTPDIPRPRYWLPETVVRTATFGVVLDTSGSMGRETLAKALGAIAAYADERGVRHVRLVYCDAAPYDEGYVSPDELRRAVAVKGRGGTFLRPAVDHLLYARDFPQDAPLLVLTDGEFEDDLSIPRTHAWVLPVSDRWVPFQSDGSPVFRIL